MSLWRNYNSILSLTRGFHGMLVFTRILAYWFSWLLWSMGWVWIYGKLQCHWIHHSYWIKLYFINKQSLEFCKSWLRYRGQKILLLIIFLWVRGFPGFLIPLFSLHMYFKSLKKKSTYFRSFPTFMGFFLELYTRLKFGHSFCLYWVKLKHYNTKCLTEK